MNAKAKIFIITVASALCCAGAHAQITMDAIQRIEAAAAQDSTSMQESAAKIILDSTLVGKDIFEIMPVRHEDIQGGVVVRQSDEVREALRNKIRESTISQATGYRVRIYFSNDQNARTASAAAAARFMEKFGTYSVYHSYTNPNFKVTVGDFKTKSEALELLSLVKRDFPSAFIVKENIVTNY